MSAPPRYRVLEGDPPELLIFDEPHECPYLPEQTARLPLRLPIRPLDRLQMADRLARGERRQGRLVYRTACPSCNACEPIRIPVREFAMSRGQRRIYRRGRRLLQVERARPATDSRRVELYNRHKVVRGLMTQDGPISRESYAAALADTCCETFELRYRLEGELVGVAIVDRAQDALSAVYCYFDPDHGALSPGAFSILYLVQLCRHWGLPYLYLGLTIDRCKAMTYKRRYLPHERMIDGHWQRFERPETAEK